MLTDLARAPVTDALRALLVYARKLMFAPTQLAEEVVDQVLAAGCDEDALHDVISICGRAAFMQRLVSAYGVKPLATHIAAELAQKRVKRDYVNLYSIFRQDTPFSST